MDSPSQIIARQAWLAIPKLIALAWLQLDRHGWRSLDRQSQIDYRQAGMVDCPQIDSPSLLNSQTGMVCGPQMDSPRQIIARQAWLAVPRLIVIARLKLHRHGWRSLDGQSQFSPRMLLGRHCWLSLDLQPQLNYSQTGMVEFSPSEVIFQLGCQLQ